MPVIKRFSYKQYTWLLCVTLVLLVALCSLEKRINNNTQNQLEEAYTHAQQIITDKEVSFINLMNGVLSDTANLQRNWSDVIELGLKENISILILKRDTLLLWSNNTISLNDIPPQLPMGSGFIKAPNGYYLSSKQQRGSFTFVLLYNIKTNYPFRNQYIDNNFDTELGFIKDGFVVTKPLEGFRDMKDITGNYLFSLQIYSFTETTPFWLCLLIGLALIVLLICIHTLMQHYITTHLILSTLLFVMVLLALRWVNVFYHIPAFIYELKLFDSQIYASSIWFPSLGDLLVNAAIVLWYLVLLEGRTSIDEDKNEIKPVHFYTRLLLYLILCLSATHIGVSFIRSLTLDSQISFNINNVFSINIFTYLGLIVCILILLSVYFLSRNLVRFINQQQPRFFQTSLAISLAIIAYVLLSYFTIEADHFHTLITVSLLSTFIIFKATPIKLNRFQQYFVVIFIIALASSVSINHWLSAKEQENRKLFATKLVSQNDITTDYFLKSVEKKIATDEYVVDYFLNPIIIKSQFEKRIRQLYFTGYLSKFEVRILDYDSLGYYFKEKSNFTFNEINRLYKTKTIETINSHFRYLTNKADLKGYLAKFEVIHKKHKIGYIFILLEPKLIQDENRFDELLIDGFRQTNRKLFDYSYAVYKDKSLIFQSGNYPYRIKNTWGETANEYKFFNEQEFDHLLYTDNQPLTIIISKQRDSLLQTIGLFSFIFTFCTVTLILILFIYISLNAQLLLQLRWYRSGFFTTLRDAFNRVLMIERPEVFYIRTRIQTAIIFIVFITLLLTSYFTISFITQKYNNRQTERLMKKLRNVILTVENENISNFEYSNAGELSAFINQIADFYDTDITLFDKQGHVMASSIGKIYDEGVIASVMNPSAFFHLELLRESQYIHNENIALLEFQAAYAPVFKNKTEVLGYLQLPYFSQQADLLTEISSVIVGFINLYVLLFIIIGIIAYLVSRNISYPLILIQQKLSKTVLGEKNELINWHRDDEIGELVKQYNRMIEQLEASAKKLAETEREGAWREIARQIAHEIKNPLTPMKLSIQHLQRAYKNGDTNIEEKLNKTTTLLINQIDTLSELANEFSSFAKMPAPNYEPLNVKIALEEIVSLYSLNTEAQLILECNVQSELLFDRSYFSRSIGNIVKNAIQAIPENQEGMVQVIATEHTENIEIIVKDNGTGMSKDQASQIFKPYFSTKISGMGLGLPIVKNMIESGGGTITFITETGNGTTFTVTLPKQVR
jgi:signal transduction histidine kinase